MRVLVTGARGFVGRHTTAELAARNHEVVALDRRPWEDHWVLPGVRHEILEDWRQESIDAVFSRHRPEAIIHLAGWAHVGQSWSHIPEVFEANTLLAARVYTAALRADVSSFLFVSSADIHGRPSPDDLPLHEESPVDPHSPYAISKHAAEELLGVLAEYQPVRLIVARPFNHTGPGQDPNFVCPAFARQIAEIECGNQAILRHGNLEPKRDFLDVRDVARAYALLLESEEARGVYTIASGESRPVRSVLEELCDLAGIHPEWEPDPTRMRPVDTMELRGSARRLRQETGWIPQIPFHDTLKDLLDEARAVVMARR